MSCKHELGVVIGAPEKEWIEPVVCGYGPYEVGFSLHDLTSDGREDIFVQQGGCGSGGYTAWRVISGHGAEVSQIFRRAAADTGIEPRAGMLRVRAAVYDWETDAHCCPSFMRYSTLKWDGQRFVRIATRLTPTDL